PAEIKDSLKEPNARLTYEWIKDEADRQVFRVQTDKPSLAVFSEVMYPGWKAWVDHQPADLYTADHLFRSLYLPAGKHDIEFRFEPDWRWPLFMGLILWVLFTTLLLFPRPFFQGKHMRNPLFPLI